MATADQVKAFTLEVEGSTQSIEALLGVEQAIAKNTAAIKKLKAESDSAGKTLGTLTNEAQRLANQEKSLGIELDRVNTRMAELLKQNKQAGNEYKTLKQQKQDLTAAYAKNQQQIAKNNQSQATYNKTLERTKTDLTQLTAANALERNSAAQLRREIDQQTRAFDAQAKKIPKDSIAGLTREYNKLTQQYERMSLAERNSAKGQDMARHMAIISKETNTARLAVNNFKQNIGNYPGRNVIGNLQQFSRQALAAFGLGSALFVGINLIRDGIGAVKDFELSLSQLSSLTGLTGKALEDIGNKAIQFSTEFGLSATELIRIFTVVGSKLPQLLQDPENLARVSRDAEILAKASGLAVEDAVQGLSLSVAQFQIPIEQTRDVIDILATGAQKGAAEIPQISEALHNVGNVAHVTGLSLETTVSAIEALAKGGVVGSEAGIKLRNILLSLAATGRDELNPALTPLPDILETLSKELGLITDPANAASKATELFDKRNVGAALALIGQRDELRRLDGTLLDHGNALRQAITNTDNLAGSWDKLSAAFTAAEIKIFSFGKESDSLLKGLTQFFNDIGQSGLIAILGFESASAAQRRLAAEFIHNKELEQDQADRLQNLINLTNKLFNIEEPKQAPFILDPKEAERRRQLAIEQAGSTDILSSTSIPELKARIKELLAQTGLDENQSIKRATFLDALRDRIRELTGTGPGGGTQKFAAGTIGFIEKQITELKQKLAVSTDDTVIKKTVEQIEELQKAIDDIKFKLDLFATQEGSIDNIRLKIQQLKKELSAEGDDTARAEIQSKITKLETQAAQIEKAISRIDNLSKPGIPLDTQLKLSPTQLTDHARGELTNSSLFALPGESFEETQARLQKQFQSEEDLRQQHLKANVEMERAAAEEVVQIYEDKNAALVGAVEDLTNAISDVFSNNAETQKKGFKEILLSFAKYIEAQIRIQALAEIASAKIAAIGKAALTGGVLTPLALAQFAAQAAITNAILSAAFAGINALIGSFETGLAAGPIKPKDGTPFRRPGSSDNVLVHARVGERIVNEEQQRHIETVHGKDFWKNAAMGRLTKTASLNHVIKMNNINDARLSLSDHDINRISSALSESVGDAVEGGITGNRKRLRKDLVK